MAKGKKTKIRKMDVILFIIAVTLVAFTVEMIALYKETGAIPDTLCGCVFAALTGECGAMAWIKTTEERRTDRKWQLQDEERAEKRQQETAHKEDV